MFETLEAAIEEVEIPVDGAALSEILALVDRLEAKVVTAVGEFDRAGLWELDAATSMTGWLRHNARTSGARASSMTRSARRLRDLPGTAAAWSNGSMSSGQVQAVVANLDDGTAPLFADHEPAVLPTLAGLSCRDAALAMQAWKARAESLVEAEGPTDLARTTYLSQTLDGRWEMQGSFDAEAGQVIATAVRLATSPDTEAEPPRSPARGRADALVDVCRFFLDHQKGAPRGRNRPHLDVVIDYDDLVNRRPGRLADGGYVASSTIQAMLCDAKVHRVVTEGRSSILDYGRSTRTVPANLRAALVLRDRHCRHPACDRPSWWCEAHHVIPVLDGGPTCLTNLVLKCSRHHHIGHQPGWAEKLKPDGTLVLSDPSGRTWTTHPPGV